MVDQNNDGEEFLNNIDGVGPMNEAMYRQQEKARQKKALAWMHNPSTPRSLGIACTIFRRALPLMSILFNSSKGTSGTAPRFSILDFVAAESSPVESLMRALRIQLADMDGDAWRLVRPWTNENIHDTACAAWTFLGELFMRSIMVSFRLLFFIFKLGQ